MKKNQSLHSQFKDLADSTIVMQIFNVIEQNPYSSEGKITKKTGLATGLVHSFLRRIISKGWIHTKKVNAKRWAYFITPKGFIEKSRLSASYISKVFSQYREIQKHIDQNLLYCYQNNWRNLAVIGKNDFAEIALLNIHSRNYFRLVGIFDESGKPGSSHDCEVLHYEDLANYEFDKALICDGKFLEWKFKNSGIISSSKLVNMLPAFTMPEYNKQI
ncbi:MAG: MarR family winged helix-turn-helix transcriptional regulator [Deltaproteobacteria bacterium]|nr:MarR family winged helix-turn-helix transcriptional regulator [Deltaproteobacteria bacterium]